MRYRDDHPSDQDLVAAAASELSRAHTAEIREHLTGCGSCRARSTELEDAIAAFVRSHQDRLDPLLPPDAGPRALLKAQLAAVAAQPDPRPLWGRPMAFAAMAAVLLLAMWLTRPPGHSKPPYAPSSRLTPGAARPVSLGDVCGADLPKNRVVSAALQRQVFAAYGIADADPRAYEVDYLITPALGGADDIRNLWPQPYTASIWNARVKDALEDRLHELVCGGNLDLATAQEEIARDWIAAYRKYFHTETPLPPEAEGGSQ